MCTIVLSLMKGHTHDFKHLLRNTLASKTHCHMPLQTTHTEREMKTAAKPPQILSQFSILIVNADLEATGNVKCRLSRLKI